VGVLVYNSWLGERSRAGIPLLRGAMSPEMGHAENVARKIKIELEKRKLQHEPVGVDIIEPPILFALQKEGIKVIDGQQIMSDARVIKTQDEITLLNMFAMMVDAAYDELYRAMKPGMSENEAVGLVIFSATRGHARGVGGGAFQIDAIFPIDGHCSVGFQCHSRISLSSDTH
jgi:Xaa-Pro aminopeptidase